MDTVAPEKTTVADERTSTPNEDVFQVILYNDNVNTVDYVVLCLIFVFGHSVQLATKIMAEAHRQGRAIAEVEAESLARQHAAALLGAGLSASVEKI